jgi:hypothetical protein
MRKYEHDLKVAVYFIAPTRLCNGLLCYEGTAGLFPQEFNNEATKCVTVLLQAIWQVEDS